MVPINDVYQTVLDTANKEARGYITPREFNNWANQAQLEIFEKYFYDQNRASATNRMSASDYGDLMKNLREKITFFDTTATVSNLMADPDGFFRYPTNFYRLGIVSIGTNYADEVSHKEILYIEAGPLTASTAKQPKYTRHEDGVMVYPTATTSVNMVYVRRPATPHWGGASAAGQTVPFPVADRNTDPSNANYYQDFDLHPSEEPELVAKILAYAGIAIRSSEVAQAGALKDQQITQNES